MIVGMDFGTTNSGMAVHDGRQVKLLPLDPANANPNVARTALYLNNDLHLSLGRDAINRYFDQNLGRPVKFKKVWVGEVEVYGADTYYVTDVFAWSDVLSPGRLFLSIKSGLRDLEFQGTVVGRFYYSLEDLVALYLYMTKMRAEQLLGLEFSEVVLGRPVHFSLDPEADALAQQRLLEAAFRAGYERVHLQYEPIAAAYHYATGLGRPQNILVFDFGGGTLDLTVMRIDGLQREVLATGGLPVAGDVFDQRLVRALLPYHFGEGTYYGTKNRRMPLPKWVFDVFSDWQTIMELQTPESRQLLEEIAQTAEDRQGVESLINLVSNNYSLQMFDEVEAAKRQLSKDMATFIRVSGPGFDVTELVTRTQFEQIIRAEIQAIENSVEETVTESGLENAEIDAVIRTGGSSNIPAFRYMLMEKFGREKLVASDTFSSVTAGLGIIGYGIDSGEIESKVFTPVDRRYFESPAISSNVTSVNLGMLQKRMAAQAASRNSDPVGQQTALLRLTHEYKLQVEPIDPKQLDTKQPVELQNYAEGSARPLQFALLLPLDEQLLIITSRYRFILTSPRDLLELKELELTTAEFLQLKVDERICAIQSWRKIKQYPKLILITSRGYARAYEVKRLIEGIEAPVSLHFDEPLPGVPKAMLAADGHLQLILILDSGRAVRYQEGKIPTRGIQTINLREGEVVAGAVVVEDTCEIGLITAGGFGKRLPVEWIPVPAKPNSRGKVVAARRNVRGVTPADPETVCWAITSNGLLPFNTDDIPLDVSLTTKSQRFLKLFAGHEIVGLINQ